MDTFRELAEAASDRDLGKVLEALLNLPEEFDDSDLDAFDEAFDYLIGWSSEGFKRG